jgi:hypothetical protein
MRLEGQYDGKQQEVLDSKCGGSTVFPAVLPSLVPLEDYSGIFPLVYYVSSISPSIVV